MTTDEIIANATVLTDENDQPVVVMATCGTCGRTWNDAAISSITPTPAGRCPWEADHETMTDRQALELLRLLHLYVTSYPESADSALTVADVAEDCVTSMEYSAEAETLNDEIQATLA